MLGIGRGDCGDNLESDEGLSMTQYHIRGLNWKPRTKSDFVSLIIESGWIGSKTALRGMDKKELKSIWSNMKQSKIITIMRKPVHLDNGQAQTSDTVKEGETHGT